MIIRSNSKKAKEIIKSEIRNYYGNDPDNYKYGKNYIKNMKEDAEAASLPKHYSDQAKGKHLVEIGNFAAYYDDERKMLGKIYGKKNVEKWTNTKVHNTYGNLIGREYASLLKQSKKNKKKITKRKGK